MIRPVVLSHRVRPLPGLLSDGRLVARSARRKRTAVAVVCSVLASLGTVLGPTAALGPSAAHAATPTLTCTSGRGTDSCSVGAITDTSFTMTYTVKFVDPVCDRTSSNSPCTYSVFTQLDAYGAGNAASPSTDCPWNHGSAGGYSPGFSYGTTGFTCTQTWSWGVNDVPTRFHTGITELSGDASTNPNTGHDFTVTYPRPAPATSFTATPDSNTRGLYHLVSTSTGSSDLTYEWRIGTNDRAGAGPILDYTFPSSGTYEVALRVTDRLGQRTESVRQLTVTLTDLTAAITITGADGRPLTGGASAPGQTLRAVVTLGALNASADITGVTADPPMTVSPGTALRLVSGPPPVVPTTVSKATTAQYVMTYTVLAAGQARLAVHVTGTEGTDPQSADADAVAHLGQPLAVTVSWSQGGKPILLEVPGKPSLPDTIRLADADDGEVPQDVIAVVRIKNTSTVTQRSISVNGIPALSYHVPVQATQVLPVGVTGGPTPSRSPGDLAPGETAAPINYRVHVTNNGAFDFSPQVLSSSDGTDNTEVSQGVGTITVLPTALLWLSLHKVGSGSVRAGTQQGLSGTLTNRSLTQAVEVAPLEPATVEGNAGGGRLVDASRPGGVAGSTLPDGVQLPFFGPLRPGQVLDLAGAVDTTYVPGTRATLTYKPAGTVVGDDGAKTDLVGTQVGISAGSSPLTFAIDVTDPAVPPADYQTTTQNFTDAAVQGTAAWAAGGYRGALAFLRHPIDGASAAVSGFAKVVVRTPRQLLEARAILGSCELYGVAYLALTPQQRQEFAKQILDDFDASTLKADNKELSDSVQQGFGAFADAAAHGDYNKLAALSGAGFASGAGALADAVLTDVVFQKFSLGMRAAASSGKNVIKGQLASSIVLADKLAEARLGKAVIKTVKGVKAGQNLLLNKASALVNAWGLNPSQITALQRFCKDNGIVVAVRARSKRAADLIRRGLAIGKNEVLKLKAVDDIDVKYLGYRQNDLSKLFFAEPLPLADVEANLKRYGANATTRELALKRHALRVEEWTSPKVRDVMQRANAAKEIDWGFNGTDNGAPQADRAGKRRFSLYDEKGQTMHDGTHRTYQQVLVGDLPGLAGKLVNVTQDVDVFAILSAGGDILGPQARTAAYEFLSLVLGIEHPESASWLQKGEILFNAKVKELSRVAPGGGEALAVFGPDRSVRAGFLNAALTIYDSTTKGGVIFFHGGYNNPYAKAVTRIRSKIKRYVQ